MVLLLCVSICVVSCSISMFCAYPAPLLLIYIFLSISLFLCLTVILYSISISLYIYSISLTPRTFLYIQPFTDSHIPLPFIHISPDPLSVPHKLYILPRPLSSSPIFSLPFHICSLRSPHISPSFRLFPHFPSLSALLVELHSPRFPLSVVRRSLFPSSIRSRTGHVLGDSSSTAEIFSPCNFAVGRGNDGNYGTATVETPFRVRYLARFTGISRQADFPSARRWIGKMAGIPKSRRGVPR